MCHPKKIKKERQRKTEAEIHGYFGEGSRRWAECGGTPTNVELKNTVAEMVATSPGIRHFGKDKVRSATR